MKQYLVLSILLAGLATAEFAPVQDQTNRFHQRAIDNSHREIFANAIPPDGSSALSSRVIPQAHYKTRPKSQEGLDFSQPRSQITRRSAMEQAGRGSKSPSRSSSPGTQSHSSRSSSPLRLPPFSSSSSSYAHPSGSNSRSSSLSDPSRSSGETSWNRPPKDYKEAFQRLGITPPQSPRSRQKAQQQRQRVASQNGHLNGQHHQLGAAAVGEPKDISGLASPNSQSSSASASTAVKI